MRIAVLGSWHTKKAWPLQETCDEFQRASRQVGHELAARGHSLIVGSDGDHTADCHAALGALDFYRQARAPIGSPRILVIRAGAEATRRAFEPMRRTDPGVFVDYPIAAGSQAVVKLIQTSLADAVVLIGGAEHTEQAGIAAAVSHKPLGAIGSFGGAAAMLVRRFAEAPMRWGYTKEQWPRLLQLLDPYSDVVLRSAFELAWIEGAPKLMLIHGRSDDCIGLKEKLKQAGLADRATILRDEYGSTDSIPDKFERHASSVDGAIALVTPDDIGSLAAELPLAAPRARENVWIEVGWFWGRRGRSRLLLMTKGNVTIPSDLANVDHENYVADPWECEGKIRQFIEHLRSASDVRAD